MSIRYGSIGDDLRSSQDIDAMTYAELLRALDLESAVLDAMIVQIEANRGFSFDRAMTGLGDISGHKDLTYEEYARRVLALTGRVSNLSSFDGLFLLTRRIRTELRNAGFRARAGDLEAARSYFKTEHRIDNRTP